VVIFSAYERLPTSPPKAVVATLVKLRATDRELTDTILTHIAAHAGTPANKAAP
jgi:hypothetical protein